MKVSVKLLATYRDLLPEGATGNTCTIEIPEGSSFTAVLTYFNLDHDEASVTLVNGRTPDPKDQLREGDAVCIFPSMAGG